MICSPLRSLMIYVHGTVFLVFLITNISSDQFGLYTLANIFLYFEILTRSRILNLGSAILTSFLESIYVLFLTSTGYCIDLQYHLIYQYTHF